MISEINLDGVFISTAVVTAIVAGILMLVVKRVLAGLGAYQFFWHRNLVDLALFIILWACVAQCASLISAIWSW